MIQRQTLAGRYRVGTRLGSGGTAEVHLAQDVRLGRTVAVKTLRADLAFDSYFHERFRREARSAASLNHPSVVAVYDSGEEQLTGGGVLPYIVMEYVPGTSLAERPRSETPPTLQQALELTDGVLRALEHAHGAGIVHRDVKPAKVMLTADGAVKVMDFGIARAMSGRETSSVITVLVSARDRRADTASASTTHNEKLVTTHWAASAALFALGSTPRSSTGPTSGRSMQSGLSGRDGAAKP